MFEASLANTGGRDSHAVTGADCQYVSSDQGLYPIAAFSQILRYILKSVRGRGRGQLEVQMIPA